MNAPGTGTPAGSAEFFDGATSLGTVALNASGVATLSTSALTVAAHSITAKYLGSTNYNQSTSAVLTQTVEKAETSTALTSSVNPSKFGQSVTFTATVSVSSPGSGAPSGTVTFMEGATTLGTGTLSGGVATFMTNALAVGHHDITAVYEGDSSFNGSTSNTVDQEVQKADTTTALTSSVNPSKFGQSVTFTATVSVSSPGSGTPSGTVTFKEGATTLGTGTLSGGVATFMTNALAVGHHDITAVYEGDSSFNGSTSNTVDQEVQKADTTTALTSSVNPSKFGQSVTFTATVSVSSPGSGTPSGTVTFMEGAATLGTGTLNASGVATFTITTLSVGNHTIKAIYGGDGSFNGSTSTEVTQVVEKADTSTTVTSAPNPSLLNEAVTFTATVNPVAPGAGTRTGSVTFKEGATVLGTGTVNASGQATFTTSSLGAGSHTIKAFYGGDGNFNPSDGTMASAQTVNYTFDGFYAPVDKLPIVNSAKAGQAIPTKWRLTDLNGTGVSDPSSFVGLTSVPCSVSGSEPVDEMTEYAAGSSGLQYLGNGNWQYNWKTPKEFALQCRIARVTLLDGSVHEFKVQFKK